MPRPTYLCPACGSQSMVRKPIRRPGWYVLECRECGLRRGPLSGRRGGGD